MSNQTILGWIPLNEDGTPHRPLRSNRYHSVQNKVIRKPVTVYQTEQKAQQYSPCKSAKPVYINE